jgi:hypothetical protein
MIGSWSVKVAGCESAFKAEFASAKNQFMGWITVSLRVKEHAFCDRIHLLI